MNVRNNHEMPSNIEPLKEDPGETEISLQSICILDASLSRFAAALPDFLEVHVLPENDYLPQLKEHTGETRTMELVSFIVSRDFLEKFRLDLWNWIKDSPLREVRFVVLSNTDLDLKSLQPLPEELVHLVLPEQVSPSGCGAKCTLST